MKMEDGDIFILLRCEHQLLDLCQTQILEGAPSPELQRQTQCWGFPAVSGDTHTLATSSCSGNYMAVKHEGATVLN